MKWTLIVTLVLNVVTTPVSASLLIPEHEWRASRDGRFDVLVDNATATVTVFDHGRTQTPRMAVQLSAFDATYSRVEVLGTPPAVVHVRGAVNSIEDTGLAIMYPDGHAVAFSVKTFVARLREKPVELRGVDDIPLVYWMRRVEVISGEEMRITAADGCVHLLNVRTATLSTDSPCEKGAAAPMTSRTRSMRPGIWRNR